MNKVCKKYIQSFTFIIFVVSCVFLLISTNKFPSLYEFVNRVETIIFDFRQEITSKQRKCSEDIVILTIDDESYEYIMEKFGSWPVSREKWAKILHGLEMGKPRSIMLDLLFVKPNLYDKNGDNELVKVASEYDNIYFSYNFDNYDQVVRRPIELDKKYSVLIESEKFVRDNSIKFKNVRFIMPELANATSKAGAVNVIRDDDGVIRSMAPLFEYKARFFPNLVLKYVVDELGLEKMTYKDSSLILHGDFNIPLNSTNKAILNWYGPKGTFQYIPFWRVAEAIKNNNVEFIKTNFNSKIIFIGVSATSLSDIKSVPVDASYPGVEIHATFLNNILDNNFIKKTSMLVDFLITLFLCWYVGYFVLSLSSVVKTFAFLFSALLLYFVTSIVVMLNLNLWIAYVIPAICVLITFVLIYCEKYVLKSEDYEEMYKLSVTDGLTKLYNHRYFKESMTNLISNFTRYNTRFSLIMIDIDFFKKFNDTYGHQSGDCVLRQVANILKDNSRTSDIVCRYGGEEMTVILTNTEKKDAVIVAQKICQAVRDFDFILANNEHVKVTISLGVSTVGEDGVELKEIIEYCDKCLYKAKENGRNQVVYTL